MPPSTPAAALTEAQRTASAQHAAAVAAVAVAYYQTRVNVEDPSTVDAWLAFVVGRILTERDTLGRASAAYGDKMRSLELPGVNDRFRFDPGSSKLDPAIVRTSLYVTGVADRNKRLDEALARGDIDATGKQQLIDQANASAAEAVRGAAMRHTLNGSRSVILDGVERDTKAFGYVRTTKANPCYFCAMLASRGPVYAKDSFDDSNPRFTGDGTARVHDHCGCGTAPVYSRKNNPLLDNAEKYEKMWLEAGTAPKGVDQVTQFRRLYENRVQS